MANIKGISDEQCAALAGIQVGDLIFIQKIVAPSTYKNDDEDEEDLDDDDEVEGDGEAVSDEDDTASQSSSDDESQHEDEDEEEGVAEDSDETDATEISVPPRMYVVSAVAHDFAGTIINVQVSRLKYSSTVTDDPHTYQLYAGECVHSHPMTCGQPETPCGTASSVENILEDENFTIKIKPNGDVVKNADQDVRGTNIYGRCIPGCHSGYLASHEMLRNMVKDYNPPTLSVEGQDLSKIMPSVCPVCFGIEALQEQQNLQCSLLLGAPPEIGEIVDFLGSLNGRRRQLGYHFRQMDEREWGMVFDDMNSEEEYDGRSEDDGRWEHWAEAMDPNSVIQTRPASDATIASLARKSAKGAKLGEDVCKICQEDVKAEHIIIELPCGHVDQHEECIASWLKYNNTCPTCRAPVPAVDDTPHLGIAAPESNGINGEDTVMSDA